VAFTLPESTIAALSYVSLRLGVNKSHLVAAFLDDPLSQLKALLFTFPDPLDRLSESDKASLQVQLESMLRSAAAPALTIADELHRGAGGHNV
jgi:hypothetical protein